MLLKLASKSLICLSGNIGTFQCIYRTIGHVYSSNFVAMDVTICIILKRRSEPVRESGEIMFHKNFAQYLLLNNTLYRREFSNSLLR